MKMFSMKVKDHKGVEREAGPLTKIYTLACVTTGVLVVNNFIISKALDGIRYLDNKFATK